MYDNDQNNGLNNDGFNQYPNNNNFNGNMNNQFVNYDQTNSNTYMSNNQMDNGYNNMSMNNDYNNMPNNQMDNGYNNMQMNNGFNGMPDNQMNNDYNNMPMNNGFNGMSNNQMDNGYNNMPMNGGFNGMPDNQTNSGYNNMPMNNGFNGMPNNQMNNGYNNMPNGQMNYGYNNMNGNYQNNKENIFKKNKKLFIILGIVLLIIIYLACSGHFSKKPSTLNRDADYERLIMIYMVGSNLESGPVGAGSLDLNGIDYNTMESKNTKVIVIAGGSTNWKNNYVDVQTTSIYELKSNGYEIVKKQNRLNMGDTNVFKEFLNYGYENYAAKKYDLIFWNHGMGVLGGGSDEFTNDWLTLDEMKKALDKSYFGNDFKLELVIFRTCLNGTIEVADTYKNYADYLVASEETTWMYKDNNVLKVLNDIDVNDNGKQFGTKYIDGYMNYVGIMNTTYNYYTYNTYGLFDLSKIDKLEKSLAEFFGSIDLNSKYSEIAKVRASMLQYGKEDPSYDSIDLYNFISKLSYLSESKAKTVLNNLNEVILYSKATDSNSKGLSIYFPYNGAKDMMNRIISGFYTFDGLKDYKRFISSFISIQGSNNTPMSLAGSVTDVLHNDKKKEINFQLTLTNEQMLTFGKARYIVFEKSKVNYTGSDKSSENEYLPIYSSNDITIDNNVLKASFKDKQLKWVDVSDKSEQTITLNEAEITDDYIIYNAICLLSNYDFNHLESDLKIDQAELVIRLDKKTNKISIVSVLVKGEKDSTDQIASNPYNVVASLDDYNYIAFSTTRYSIVDEEGNYNNKWESSDVGVVQLKIKDMKLELEDFKKNKEYYAAFIIKDIYGNVSYSKLVKVNNLK